MYRNCFNYILRYSRNLFSGTDNCRVLLLSNPCTRQLSEQNCPYVEHLIRPFTILSVHRTVRCKFLICQCKRRIIFNTEHLCHRTKILSGAVRYRKTLIAVLSRFKNHCTVRCANSAVAFYFFGLQQCCVFPPPVNVVNLFRKKLISKKLSESRFLIEFSQVWEKNQQR